MANKDKFRKWIKSNTYLVDILLDDYELGNLNKSVLVSLFNKIHHIVPKTVDMKTVDPDTIDYLTAPVDEELVRECIVNQEPVIGTIKISFDDLFAGTDQRIEEILMMELLGTAKWTKHINDIEYTCLGADGNNMYFEVCAAVYGPNGDENSN